MTSINFNPAANNAANIITKNQRSIDQAMTRLASGTKMNSAADNPAMLASFNNLTASGVASRAAVQSLNHGIAYVTVVDDAAANIEGLLVRMKDLAVQASSTAMSAQERYGLDFEFQQLGLRWTSVSDNTKFNDKLVATGDDLIIGVGAIGGASALGSVGTMKIFIDDYRPSAKNTTVGSLGLGIASGASVLGAASSGGTAKGAMLNFNDVALAGAVPRTGSESISSAITAKLSSAKLTNMIANFGNSRAKLGSALNAMTSISDSISNQAAGFENAAAKVGNTNYAAETAKLSASQIISQASTAILAQANAQSATILSLLK